jgi:hypothetical protein
MVIAVAQEDLGFSIPEYSVPYTEVLRSIHTHLRPRRYMEIGTQTGTTLALADCTSLAVDPDFQITRDVIGKKPACFLYQMTSDQFFDAHDPQRILGGPIDLAFLDGLHWFEFLLRDFIHTEAHAARNSIVLMHDCLPTDLHIARRDIADDSRASISPHPEWWAGDVWKTVAILQAYRPDLMIYGSQVAPTGLVAITNLDPKSTVLEDNYFKAVADYQHLEISAMWNYFEKLPMIEPYELLSDSNLAKRFWL